MSLDDITRRQYVALFGIAAAGALAGCTSDADDASLEPVDDDDTAGNDADGTAADDDDDDDDDDAGAGTDDSGDEADGADDDDETDELRQMDLSWGDTVEHPDGFRITPAEPEVLDSYETEDWRGDLETIEPEREQFVFVEITIENVSDSTITTPNALNFEVIAGGQQFERRSALDQREGDERYPSLDDFAPGTSGSGVLSYDTVAGEPELFYSGRTEDFRTVEAIWS